MEEKRSGEFVGAFPAYGYVKSSEDNHKLIIDEEAAEVVRKIQKTENPVELNRNLC